MSAAPNGISDVLTKAYMDFTVKAEYAYDYGMPHWLASLDRLLGPLHLERAFIGRHKASHFRIWYRDALADYVRGTLLDSRTLARPYFDRKTLEAVVQRHLTGDRNHTTAIHRILTLELIQRLFFDGA
jgi:asparagine synthase (glutamine-hydrolysing)